MAWIKRKYSNEAVNRAGDLLITESASEEQKNEALEVLDNWRAAHSYPMHVFKIRLKSSALAVDSNALVVQRLKRVPAIIKKLNRRYNGRAPTMKLSQMQDIGGCRAVLSNVALARKLCEEHYLKGDLKHKLVNMKDYISNPKNDGYRSVHLIYKYASDKEGKKEYNGLLVEIQIRSKLQHLWATAIETVDFFTRQALKSNEGLEEWTEFFKLVSSGFAILEGCSPIPSTSTDEKALFLEIKKRAADLNVITVMNGWMTAMNYFEEMNKKSKNAQYFLLELDIRGSKLNITEYTKNNEQKAIQAYTDSEKKNKDRREYDVVLVGADASTDLRKAYPNYFVDSKEFLSTLTKIMNKYPE